MAMVSITNSYGGQNLSLVQKGAGVAGLNWGDYALKIPKKQLDTLSMDLVLAVLTQTGKSPTELAQINKDEIMSILLHSLDKEFRASQLKYKNALADAEGLDLQKIATLEANHTIKNYGGMFGWVFSVLESLGCNYRSTEFVKEEGSVNRIKFVYGVEKGETERHQKLKDTINLALDPLIEALEKLNAQNQVDMNMLKEARQLAGVYKSVFPTTPLVKKGKNIDTLLDEFDPSAE